MIKILKENHNTILIFIIPLILILIGFAVYRDYGISSDEEITRNNSLVSIKYIFDVLFPQYTDNFELLKNVPNLRDYDLTDAYKFPGLASSAYGVFFDVLVVAFIEILLEVKNFSDVFYYRHLTNHYLFVISVICFYFLCISVFKNKLYSFFGAAILYTSPRIFAESFYNNKDVAFLSFFIFLIFFSIKFIKKPNYYNAFLLSIFAAMATSTRIIGIYVGILVALFFIIEFLMKNKFDPKKANTLVFFLFFNLIFLYLFWPFLWENPISNLIHAIKYAANVPTGLNVFYLGDFYGVKYLPWHYLAVCFFATTPILILILIAGGLVNLTLRFSRRLINIDKNDSYKDIWRGEKEKIFLFLLLVIFVPILSIFLFNSIVYNSWRHIFFLYPPLILVSIYFLDIIVIKFRFKKISSYINIILLVAVLSNVYYLITLHPFQGIYFNSIFEKNANKLFEIDYWGISNKHSLEELAKKNIGKNKITVGVASFTNLWLSEKMLNKKFQNKLIISGQDFSSADFIFNNNYFGSNPNYDDRYLIPENYKKYSELRKGKILISEFYIKE